jgi:hypothetical protein
MRAYHFLRDDMTSSHGSEPPWRVGETRRIDEPIELCARGYHASLTWYNAVLYAPGPVACIVELGGRIILGDDKAVATERTLVAARNVERELRQFACDIAYTWVEDERRQGYLTDARSLAALDVARRYLRGEATDSARRHAEQLAFQAWSDGLVSKTEGCAENVILASLDPSAALAASSSMRCVLLSSRTVHRQIWEERLRTRLNAVLTSVFPAEMVEKKENDGA